MKNPMMKRQKIYTIHRFPTVSKNPVMIKLAELSCQVDSDQHRGFRQCDECGDGIDDEQTFYFWNKETTDKTFCHPSCVTLHYLIPWIEEKQDDKNNR